MKKITLLFILFVLPLVFFACKEDTELGKLTPIGFDKKTIEIPREGGTAVSTSKKTGWSIFSWYEYTENDTLHFHNELQEKNEQMFFKDTVSGDWYKMYKDGKKFSVELKPNTSEKERSLKVDLDGIGLLFEEITITQK